MKTKEQSQQMKRESKATYADSRNVRATHQSLLELRGMPDPKTTRTQVA